MTIKESFSDEMEKIAKALIRSGRRPITAMNFVKKAEIAKLSSKHSFGAGVAVGATGLHMLHKANEDRKLGKAVRTQQTS